MEAAIQKLAVVALLAIGLSHIVQPRAWVQFFVMLREKGEAGVIANALLHFWPGVLIVSFHNVWRGIPMVLTVYGWLLVVKSTLYLLSPWIGLKGLAMVREEHPRKFAIAGVPMVALALLLAWDLILARP